MRDVLNQAVVIAFVLNDEAAQVQDRRVEQAVFNEEQTVAALLREVLAAPLPDGIEREIVVVDDASTDDTAAVLTPFQDDSRIRVFRQPVNRGKGAALRRGFEEARGDSSRRRPLDA